MSDDGAVDNRGVTVRSLPRFAVAMAVATLAVVALAGPSGAGDGSDDLPVDDLNEPTRDLVVLTGSPIVVDQGQEVDEVFVGDGDAVIDGRVEGPVIVLHGNAVVRGEVTDDVVVFSGRAVVADGATVGGDVLSSKRPQVADGATVEGDTRRVNFSAAFDALGTAVWVFWWIAVSISTLVAGLLFVGVFRGIATRAIATGRSSVPAAIGAGAAAGIGLPVLSALLLLTLIGSPLGLTGLFAMAPLYLVGYVVGALFLGSLILRDRVSPLLAFALGWLILRLVGLLPVLGGLVTFAATIYGLGALLVTAWGVTRAPTPQEPDASPPATEPTPA